MTAEEAALPDFAAGETTPVPSRNGNGASAPARRSAPPRQEKPPEIEITVDKPVFKREGDSFTFVWPAYDLGLTFERIRESKTTFDVECTGVYRGAHLWWDSWNLKALITRRGRAKEYADSFRPPGYSHQQAIEWWRIALEAMAVAVIREWRRGAPIETIHDYEGPLEVRFAVDRILALNEITTIFGDGESAKSWIATALLIAIAYGVELPGGLVPRLTGPVLYLDWENSEKDEFNRRVRRLLDGFGLELDSRIRWRRCNRPLSYEIEDLAPLIQREGFVAVACDSVSPMSGGSINDPEVAIQTMNAVRQLPTQAKIVIGHINRHDRDQPGPATDIAGNVQWRNQSRLMWYQTADRQVRMGEQASLQVEMHPTKANIGVRSALPINLDLRFLDPVGPVELFASTFVPTSRRASGAPANERILALLEEAKGALTAREIGDELNLKPETVRRTLVAEKREGKVIDFKPDGKKTASWTVPEKAPQQGEFGGEPQAPIEAYDEGGSDPDPSSEGAKPEPEPEPAPEGERCSMCTRPLEHYVEVADGGYEPRCAAHV